MRRLLVNMLNKDQKDVFSEVALRCFWSLGMPLPAVQPTRFEPALPTSIAGAPPAARVIDLARWAHDRQKVVRT
jgi:hypothetical protein